MTHMKKSLLSIAFFVCGLLLWKPVQAEAATQVDNLVLMVNFSDDGDNTFQTNFSRYQEMYTGPASEPNRSVSRYISTISDGQVTVNTYFPQVSSRSPFKGRHRPIQMQPMVSNLSSR